MTQTTTATQYVIRRQAQRPVSYGSWHYLDGGRYYSHSVGSTVYWTPAPWSAAVYDTPEAARESHGWSWMCEVVALPDAEADAKARRE